MQTADAIPLNDFGAGEGGNFLLLSTVVCSVCVCREVLEQGTL